jgi:1-acyl-sn-glycerol-3-phosphate acyltransferase
VNFDVLLHSIDDDFSTADSAITNRPAMADHHHRPTIETATTTTMLSPTRRSTKRIASMTASFCSWLSLFLLLGATLSVCQVQAFTTTTTTRSAAVVLRRRHHHYDHCCADRMKMMIVARTTTTGRNGRRPSSSSSALHNDALSQYTINGASSSSSSSSAANRSTGSAGAAIAAAVELVAGTSYRQPHQQRRQISAWSALVTKIGMVSFILLMCLMLPLTLLPQRLMFALRLISRNKLNRWAVLSSQWCARVAHGLLPFCRIETTTKVDNDNNNNIAAPPSPPPEPAIWVCNHISMLDVFILLIVDQRLRGRSRRPIKIIYWKQLEKNPVTKLMFRTAGFIPIDMTANAPGQDNEYDVKGFKKLLKDTKQAMADGFDIGILPEGQLNPTPERGLLPLFTGAYTLAKFSKRPIGMLGLHNVDQLWGATRGMTVLDRRIQVRHFGTAVYATADDFTNAFTNVVGTFGQRGATTSTTTTSAHPTMATAMAAPNAAPRNQATDNKNNDASGDDEPIPPPKPPTASE